MEIPLGRMDRTSKGPEACGELSVCRIVISQVARAPEDVNRRSAPLEVQLGHECTSQTTLQQPRSLKVRRYGCGLVEKHQQLSPWVHSSEKEQEEGGGEEKRRGEEKREGGIAGNQHGLPGIQINSQVLRPHFLCP